MSNIFTIPELDDLRMSEKARPLFEAVKRHIRDNVDPITEEYERLGETRTERWGFAPGQLELLQGAPRKLTSEATVESIAELAAVWLASAVAPPAAPGAE